MTEDLVGHVRTCTLRVQVNDVPFQRKWFLLVRVHLMKIAS